MADLDPMDAADAAAAALTGHGDDWAARLPDGATIRDQDAPDVFDTVQLADGTLIYRRTTAGGPTATAPYWVAVGWSAASQSRRYRPIPAGQRPFTFDEHDREN